MENENIKKAKQHKKQEVQSAAANAVLDNLFSDVEKDAFYCYRRSGKIRLGFDRDDGTVIEIALSTAWTNIRKKWKIEFLSDKKDLPEKTDRSTVRFLTAGNRRIFEAKRGRANYFDLSPPTPAQIPSATPILFLRRRICARIAPEEHKAIVEGVCLLAQMI